jgi:hypothetical protein
MKELCCCIAYINFTVGLISVCYLLFESDISVVIIYATETWRGFHILDGHPVRGCIFLPSPYPFEIAGWGVQTLLHMYL